MIPVKKILRSFAIFLMLYFLFVQAFQFMLRQDGPRGLLLSSTERVVQVLLPAAYIKFTVPAEEKPSAYSYVVKINYTSKELVRQAMLRAQQSGKSSANFETVNIPSDLFLLFSIPLSFLFSLILVTPLRWKSKGVNLLAGFLIFMVFSWLRLAVYILSSMSVNRIGIYEWTYELSNPLRILSEMFGLGGRLIVVLIIWAFLSFGKKLLKRPGTILSGSGKNIFQAAVQERKP